MNNNIIASAKNTAAAVISDNKQNALLMAKVELGKTVMQQAQARLTAVLPRLFKKYAQGKYAALAIANLYTFAQKMYLPGNAKAAFIADSVMKASALELGASFNVPTLVNDHVNSLFSSFDFKKFGLSEEDVAAK